MIPAKAITYSQPSPWVRAHMRDDFDVCDCPPGSRVLDVGCGFGKNLGILRDRGVAAVGVDPDPEGVAYCLGLGFEVRTGPAEALPVSDASFDQVILDCVLSYTAPAQALAEARRVLKPGGTLRLVAQGLGYALHTLRARRGCGRWFAARQFVSTPWFALTGRRLGDTVCFSRPMLARLCAEAGFDVISADEGPRQLGLPVFLYLAARRG